MIESVGAQEKPSTQRERGRRFWSRRYREPVSAAGAIEMSRNLPPLFDLLIRWARH